MAKMRMTLKHGTSRKSRFLADNELPETKPEWTPPEGLWSMPPKEIALTLKRDSESCEEAHQRLLDYREGNRTFLSREEMELLEEAETRLDELCRQEGVTLPVSENPVMW